MQCNLRRSVAASAAKSLQTARVMFLDTSRGGARCIVISAITMKAAAATTRTTPTMGGRESIGAAVVFVSFRKRRAPSIALAHLSALSPSPRTSACASERECVHASARDRRQSSPLAHRVGGARVSCRYWSSESTSGNGGGNGGG